LVPWPLTVVAASKVARLSPPILAGSAALTTRNPGLAGEKLAAGRICAWFARQLGSTESLEPAYAQAASKAVELLSS